MSYRVCRKFTSSTFRVEGQRCKVFLEPVYKDENGYCVWNVGFVIGKSTRQLNDWYRNRHNKRTRSLRKQIVGRSGIKTIRRGFEEVLRLRWRIEPGDGIVLDCTSGDPDRQFHAWSRWHRYHPEWMVDEERKEFLWYRPPYSDDPIRELFEISPKLPDNLLLNTAGENYWSCFSLQLKARYSALSNEEIAALLGQAQSND